MGNSSSKKPETASASTYNIVYQPPSNAQSSSSVTTTSAATHSVHSYNTSQTTASNIFQSSPQPPSRTRSSSSVTTTSAATRSVHSYNTSQTTASNVQTSQVPVYAKHTVPREVPEKAQQIIKHSANSYIIPKLQQSDRQQLQNINNPFSSLPDKFGLRICPQYNSKTGCRAEICRRLHVCFYQVMKKCNKENCEKDHSFTSDHNTMILNIFWRRRDFNLNLLTEILQNNHKAKKNTKQERDDCICLYNIMRKCNRKPCSQVHSKKSYQWEVHNEGKWLQFSYKQSDCLERVYCHPSQDSVELLPLPSELLNHKPFHALKCLLAQGQSWQVDMERMKLSTGSLSYYIRRLSTPSDITSDFHMACRWIWYWQDDDNSWKPYTDGTRKFFTVALSDQLEYHLHFGHGTFNVTLGTHTYVIDTQNMIQNNTETGKIRTVRRRPVCMIFEDKVTSFDKMFLTLPSDKKCMLFSVLPSTSEFVFIEKMIKNTLPMANLKTIQRIQNDHLWNAYQNKKSQLLALYNDLSLVNEQYLFHGTKHSVIDKICCENLDWRLYGSNVGNVYGQGTYFSNKASLSDSYSETNNLKQKAVFVLYVLVGTMTVGNSGMTLPPTNPETGRCFDTTCNDKLKSEIFVKYNRDEYYPAYIVKYYKSTF